VNYLSGAVEYGHSTWNRQGGYRLDLTSRRHDVLDAVLGIN
jgi:hypothetical protein